MIQFACPGCAGEHEVDDAYAGYEAKCVHCGLAFEIPEFEEETEPEDEEEQLVEEEQEEEEEFVPRVAPKSAAMTAPSKKGAPPTKPVSFQDRVKKWAKDRRVQAGGGGVSLLVLLIILFTGGDKPAPTPAPSPPQPPPPVVKKEVPKVEPPPPPPPPLEPLELTPQPALPPQGANVDQLLTRLQIVPQETMVGRAWRVAGIVDQTPPDGLVLSTGPGSQKLTCQFPPLRPFQAMIGAAAQLPEQPSLRPGDSVTVEGVFTRDGRLDRSTVVHTNSAADPEWKGVRVEVDGTVQAVLAPKTPDQPVIVSLEVPTWTRHKTQPARKLNVEWAFKPTLAESLASMLPGQSVRVRGVCGGRFNLTLRINDCEIVTPDAPPAPQFRKTNLESLSRAYLADIALDLPPVRSGQEVTVSADRIADICNSDIRQANEAYLGATLVVNGTIIERRDAEHLAYLEVPTSSRLRLAAYFTPSQYRRLASLPAVQLRCTFGGAIDNKLIVLDDCETVDPEPNAPRITADFLPIKPGHELTYETVKYGQGKDHTMLQIVMKFIDKENFQVLQQKLGAFSGKSLFQEKRPPVVWSKDPRNSGQLLFTLKYRTQYDMVEIGRPAKPKAGGTDTYWEPVLKIGARLGQSWKVTDPDDLEVTYTVTNFRKDKKDRDVVEVKRVAIHPKDPAAVREESVIAYAKGVGELGRTVTLHVGAATPVLRREDRLIEPGDVVDGKLESFGPGK